MYERVRNGHFQVVYGFSKMLLANEVYFNAVVLKASSCAFFKNLVCITVDKAHIA